VTTNAQRRGRLGIRVTATDAGVRVRGLGEVTLDWAEARDLAAQLSAAADAAPPNPPTPQRESTDSC